MKHQISLLLFFQFIALSATAQVTYTLSFEQRKQHYVHVSMQFETDDAVYAEVKLPAWSPGSYMIRDYAAAVENFKCTDTAGTILSTGKVSKHTWQIKSGGKKRVKVEYDVYCHDLSVRTSHITGEHAFVHSPSVLMYNEPHLRQPHHITVVLPSAWSRITSSLEFKKDGSHTALAGDYDELIDSPIELGNQEVITWEVNGVPHEAGIYGTEYFNKELLRNDLQKICSTAVSVFGSLPCKKYAFIIHATATPSGGLEHASSSALQTTHLGMAGEPMYEKFLNLAAHEYFHLWNIKRLHPQGLGPFDYEKENYSTHLWLVEGFTSYYASKILMYAGYLSQDKFLNYVASQVAYLINAPGRGTRSVAESSFDAWIVAYKPSENAGNTSTSYYNHGTALAAAMDAIIAAGGKYNLDDLMAGWYKEFYLNKNTGYTDSSLITTAKKITGTDFSSFFEQYVHGKDIPDYSKIFQKVGCRTDISRSEDVVAGISFSGMVVNQVQRHSPAWKAGISPKDELLAVEGIRVYNETSFKNLLMMWPAGSEINLLISRDEKIRNVPLHLDQSEYRSVTINADPAAGADLKKKLQNWLTR